jgi:hypothetical protein
MLVSQPSSLVDSSGLVRVAELTRRHLELDAAFIAQLTGDGHFYAAVAGDADGFGLTLGDGVPTASANGATEAVGAEEKTTFCRRLIAGDIPNVVADAISDERLADLASPQVKGPL